MRKRDSIEFLWDELKSFLPSNYTVDESVKIISILKQAKAMHKEETLKLYYAYEDYVLREEGIIKTFGQFYNETFGE